MTQKRYFTVAQANEMIPDLERSFRRIFQINKQLDNSLEDIQDKEVDLGDAEDEIATIDCEGDEVLFHKLVDLKLYSQALESEVTHLQEQGCVIKDLREGLIDWYAYNEDREVFLCWQYGEKEVTHWHEINGGFKNRRPVFELASY